MPNILLSDTKKSIDRTGILLRVLNRLLDDKDCYYSNNRGWTPLTRDQLCNWKARRTIMLALEKVKK